MHILTGLFLPISIFSKIPLKKYDKFLISTSGVGEFIAFRNYKKGQTYAYVHTPLREANEKIVGWNLENRYKKTFLKKQAYILAVKFYKILEKQAWKKLDVIIFNSELSRSRAEEHKLIDNKETFKIHPPINFSRFDKIKTKTGNYFIYFSRFNPPKRQDLLLFAWKIFTEKNPKYKLILIGTPDDKKYFEKLKRFQKRLKNVELKLNVSDKELKKLIVNSRAGIFLGYQEDFGIVPLEIIMANKPLIAVDEGGYVKLIQDNPLFHKIKEKHNRKEMVKEIAKELDNFVKKKNVKRKKSKIKIKNFIK